LTDTEFAVIKKSLKADPDEYQGGNLFSGHRDHLLYKEVFRFCLSKTTKREYTQVEERQSAPGEEWKNQTADAERLKRLEETLNRLETKVSQTSRFDWKWLLSLVVPISILLIGGVITIKLDLIAVKGDLKVLQNNNQTIRSDIQRIEGDLKEVKKDVKQLQIDQTKLTGEVQLANQKLSTIEKTVEKIQNSRR
jgi:hypothetical protein